MALKRLDGQPSRNVATTATVNEQVEARRQALLKIIRDCVANGTPIPRTRAAHGIALPVTTTAPFPLHKVAWRPDELEVSNE